MSGGDEQGPWPFERRIARRFRRRIDVLTALMFTMVGLSMIAGIATFLMPGHPSGAVTTYGHWGLRGSGYFPGSHIDLGESTDTPEVQARRSRAGTLIGIGWLSGVAAAALFGVYANTCITNNRRRQLAPPKAQAAPLSNASAG